MKDGIRREPESERDPGPDTHPFPGSACRGSMKDMERR